MVHEIHGKYKKKARVVVKLGAILVMATASLAGCSKAKRPSLAEASGTPVVSAPGAAGRGSGAPGTVKKTRSVKPARKGTVEERVKACVAEVLTNVDRARLTGGADLKRDLGADELDLVEIVMAAEEEFDCEIADADAEKFQTIGDLVAYVRTRAKR
jgi:acyl carrier protein